jgi:hypothetical protein
MATKGAGKSKGTKQRATQQQGGAVKLRELIEGVIDAHNRGDPKQRDAALSALDKFESHAGSPELRRSVIEARAAAGHDVAVDTVRLLGEIVARLDTGTRAG